MSGQSTQDLFRTGLAQAAAGQKLDSDRLGLDSSTPLSPATEDSDTEVRAEESTVDGDELSNESGDTPEDSSDSQADAEASGKPEAKSETSNREVITVRDDQGRKRQIEIDYSDRERTKKAFLMEAGARKWQAERDQERKSRTELEAKLAEKDKDWNDLEELFQQGPEALFDRLSGRKGAFEEHLEKARAHSEWKKRANPEEIKAYEAEQKAERESRESAKLRKEFEELKKKTSEDRAAAEVSALQAQVNPAFEKYRFAGKLGDAVDEHMFDEMLWDTARKRLEPYEEKGVLTQEIIDREFRAVAQAVRKRIGVQAERKATKVVEQKKQEATENAQAKVMSGYKTSNSAKEAKAMLDNGNLSGLLKNWSKYGKLFGQ